MRFSHLIAFALVLGFGCSGSSPGGAAGMGGEGGLGGEGGEGGMAGEGGMGGMPDPCDGVDCDDGDLCTTEACDSEDGSCVYTPVDCDDANECTADLCVAEDGSCSHPPVEDAVPCAEGQGSCMQGACSGLFPCTEQGVRDAIAVGFGPHSFDCDGPNKVVTAAEIVIDKDVVLEGGLSLSLDGDASHRVLSVAEGVTATLRGFAVTNGVGGIRNEGELTLEACTIAGNEQDSDSGAMGGGVANSGALTMLSCSVTDNRASAGGGGVWSSGTLLMTECNVDRNSSVSNGGGLFVQDGTASFDGGTLSGNSGGEGGAVANHATLSIRLATLADNLGLDGAALANRGALSVVDTTLRDNSASGIGGALFNAGGIVDIRTCTASGGQANRGGVLYNAGGATTISNSTFSGNHATDRGGALFNSPLCNPTCQEGTLALEAVTVAENTVGLSGTAIVNTGMIGALATSHTFGSLIIGTCSGNIAGIVSGGYNMESPGNTCGLDELTDRTGVLSTQINLLPLSDNGGPTLTHAFLPGAAPVNRIPADLCDLTLDQRGVARPQGADCDVGALELE